MLARPALMPWLTALQNIAFGLQLRGVSAGERTRKAKHLLEKVGLRDFGEAILPSFRTACSNEWLLHGRWQPILTFFFWTSLSAPSTLIRVCFQADFVRLWEETRPTVVMVTYVPTQAIAMADRVVVFTSRPGRVKYECQWSYRGRGGLLR